MNKEEKKKVLEWLKGQVNYLDYKFKNNRIIGYYKGTLLKVCEFYPRVVLKVIERDSNEQRYYTKIKR